ncbi:hypothetical protein ACFQ3P_43375 [Paraburkholderia sabiae]|uniref:Uncharacterized protein n=1 Tax=Paraburkholderia sabiae TaxID=273251 RepID=A0ABU9QSQ3_9BURK|nr:hypothetical protein [Paraburkholderia sabiae]WJZ80002.1 hypothetical protein QEN71_43435 [Paraburkholderia sabiae]CAD6563376.1 hypothetical protein LMG24235_08620 [Paraburkholderia sabiae]
MKNDPYGELARARKAFNDYVDATVKPLLALPDREVGRLGFVEIAERINEPDARRGYVERATTLLEANIAFYEGNAIPVSALEQGNASTIASTLFVAALAYRFGPGTFAALVAAAGWYWIAAEYVRRRLQDAQRTAKEHNDGVEEWAKTIRDWEAERSSLQLID